MFLGAKMDLILIFALKGLMGAGVALRQGEGRWSVMIEEAIGSGEKETHREDFSFL
jgi:hypothetical protein